MDEIQADDHLAYMRLALSLAKHSPPKPTNFRVGAVLVDPAANRVLATGYTLELPGNTHAEQICLLKLAAAHSVAEADVADVVPADCVLYTTVEPCQTRLSGSRACVDRILDTKSGSRGGIATVYVGVQEPDTFVKKNEGKVKLEGAGIACVQVPGLEKEILEVAKAGHQPPAS